MTVHTGQSSLLSELQNQKVYNKEFSLLFNHFCEQDYCNIDIGHNWEYQPSYSLRYTSTLEIFQFVTNNANCYQSRIGNCQLWKGLFTRLEQTPSKTFIWEIVLKETRNHNMPPKFSSFTFGDIFVHFCSGLDIDSAERIDAHRSRNLARNDANQGLKSPKWCKLRLEITES